MRGTLSSSRDWTDRFYEKVDFSGDCHLWTGGACGSSGKHPYGRAWFAPEKKQKQAHHVAWYLEYGELPKEKLIHSCFNKLCVNVEHLYEGTMQDACRASMIAKRHSRQKLTLDDISEIKAMLARGLKKRFISWVYDVSFVTIYEINNGKTWWYLDEKETKPKGYKKGESI